MVCRRLPLLCLVPYDSALTRRTGKVRISTEVSRMKLYYSPGACSLSPHIVSREAGIPLDLQKVSTKDKTMDGGGDYWQVNGKGYVPALKLDDGQVLTEGPAIVQYLADRKPESGLAPKNGTPERYRLQE